MNRACSSVFVIGLSALFACAPGMGTEGSSREFRELPEPRLGGSHLWDIVNAVILRATNGPAEGINSRIKTVKVRSRGFRNRKVMGRVILDALIGQKWVSQVCGNRATVVA